MSRCPGPVTQTVLLALCCALPTGCGDAETAPAQAPAGQSGSPAGSSEVGSASNGGNLPPAAIGAADDGPAADTAAAAQPNDGSPQWLIREIMRLRVEPGPETDDPARLRAHRRWRNEKIVKLARQAIQLTHAEPKKEQLFNVAVHHLMEARLELALQTSSEAGEMQQHVQQLYADAEALYRRDPKSQAAAEAAFARAKFANKNAQRFAEREPRWLEEFSRQARLFAANFPQEQARAVSLLDAAARSCELHRMPQEAGLCYTQLRDRFPTTPQGRQAAAALRRLLLKDTRLRQFGGPTIDGDYRQIDNFRGRVVLVVFWASHSQEFLRHAPKLKQLQESHGPEGFTILGVNLDEDALAAEEFLQENAWMNTVLFWPDETKRGWRNPIVRYYGVRDIPAYWLVDRSGIVVDPLADPMRIEQRLTSLLQNR